MAIEALKPLISDLHPRDLELLVELIFAQSGYRRQSPTGGTQKTLDIALELPITGESAFIQVKTRTDQQELDRYVTDHAGGYFDRMFYVYHTAPAPLKAPTPNVTILDLEDLSAHAVKAGLFDWVLKKAA